MQYLEARRAQLAYAAFRAAGYPSGSGSVESAHAAVVEARLKGAGMHWAPAHVDPVLVLGELRLAAQLHATRDGTDSVFLCARGLARARTQRPA